jgi:hydroxyacyl-ACP dehydratase HTD2-like protein with hotdog domain
MNAKELKSRFTGYVFDKIDLTVKTESIVGFAKACGETHSRFTDPTHPDFQAVPNYTTRIHGTRGMPEDFPIDMYRCFDAGKSVEVHAAVRAGDQIQGRSEIADVYEKTGRSGKMLFIVHRMNFYNQDDVHLSTVDWRLVQREFD